MPHRAASADGGVMELAWVAGTATAMGVLSLLVSMVYRWHDVRRMDGCDIHDPAGDLSVKAAERLRLAEQAISDRAADGPY